MHTRIPSKDIRAVYIATCYLLLYCVLLQYKTDIAILMLTFSPIVLVWMVFTILKHGKYNGRELDEHEEYGYADKNKDDLGIF